MAHSATKQTVTPLNNAQPLDLKQQVSIGLVGVTRWMRTESRLLSKNEKSVDENKLMTKNETKVREIIKEAMKLNSSVRLVTDLYVSCGNSEPALTDEECRKISTNYPYPWTEIRDWFEKI